MIDPREVALKLMGIDHYCRHCSLWDPGEGEPKTQGRCGAYSNKHIGQFGGEDCPNFSPTPREAGRVYMEPFEGEPKRD